VITGQTGDKNFMERAGSKEATLLVIGAGPAGYSAAIYAARAGLKPLMIRGEEPGGQLMLTTDVENYPGFRAPILGPQLMEEMEKQALHVGTVFEEDEILSVDFSTSPLSFVGRKSTYQAPAAVIATGASARWLGLESETFFRGFGVSACATCDGFFFKNKRVAVVGGGNSAVEEALFLTRHAREVFLIHRRDTLRAEKILQERLLSHPHVKIIWNSVVEEIVGVEAPMKSVTGVRLQNLKTGNAEILEIEGLFVAIGHTPNTGFLKGSLTLDSEGYIVGRGPGMHTEVPGLFAAGDVRDKVYRQAVTAAAQGCMAALDVQKFFLEEDISV
jgi:thioredoxin reductase (NADPH)